MNKGYYLQKVSSIQSKIHELQEEQRKVEQECLVDCAKYKVGETITLNFDDEYEYGNCETKAVIQSIYISNNLDIRYLVREEDSHGEVLWDETFIDDNIKQ